MKSLYYVHDPMCSWCWAFRPVWMRVKDDLSNEIKLIQIPGGLAADSDVVMPPRLQRMIRGHWETIQKQVPGTQFNFDFWTQCVPRRSTYPACRAVLAAENQGDMHAEAMIFAIQQAYYLQARNPSDADVLINLAGDIGLDTVRFAADLQAAETQQRLLHGCALARHIGAQGFPSLIADCDGKYTSIAIDYCDAARMSGRINAAFELAD